MHIYIASDHRGYELKEKIKSLWPELKSSENLDYTLVDLGPTSYDPEDDFTTYSKLVSKSVQSEPSSLGILICGTGAGVCMAANRHKGIRAFVAFNAEVTKLSREHNSANILCLPADFLEENSLEKILKNFLKTSPLTAEKYTRRNSALDKEDF